MFVSGTVLVLLAAAFIVSSVGAGSPPGSAARAISPVGDQSTPASPASAVLLPGAKAVKGQRTAGTPIPGSYIVVFKDRPQLSPDRIESAARQLTNHVGGRVEHVYTAALHGFSARMSAAQAKAMATDSRVASVRQDVIVASTATQVTPSWDLDRIDQPNLPLSGTYDYATDAANVNVYVMDTGVRATHAEFGGRVKSGPPPTNDDDCQGHGTAVAGAAAGSTWGVAKAATIYSIRVLGCDGAGPATSALDAIDWVTKSGPRPAVVNISWATSPQDDLDAAIRNSINAGVTYVMAAGNSNTTACDTSPSRVMEAIVVGSTDGNDNRAGFSNYGSCLDLFAPGTDIKTSAYSSDTATTSASGTSLSAPLVVGAAALYLSTHPTATSAQVGAALSACAGTGMIGNLGAGSPDRLLNSRCGAPLTITNPGRQLTATGAPVRLATIKASGGAAGNTLRYQATGLPDGLSIDTATGVISGKSTVGGSSTVEVTVTDGSASASTTFRWDVIIGYGHVTGISGLCIDDNSSSLTDGNPIQLWECQQNWIARADGTIEFVGSAPGKCMTASDTNSANGLLVVLSTCTGANSQIWAAQANGELHNPATGKCLSAPRAGWGVQLTLTACDGSAGQQWKLPSGAMSHVVTINNPGAQSILKGSQVWLKTVATSGDTTQSVSYAATGIPNGLAINASTGLITGTATTTQTSTVTLTATDTAGVSATTTYLWQVADGPITGLDGMCVDEGPSVAGSDAPAQMFPCNQSTPQRWSVRADSRLEILGQCLTVSNNATTAGSTIVMIACGSNVSQIWRPQNDGTLRNPASALCLTAPAVTARTQLTLDSCAATGNQVWTLPTTTVRVLNPGNQELWLRGAVNLQTAASSTTLSYSASGLPAGLSIDAGTGTITGTPTTIGQGTAFVIANDASGARGAAAFTWTVHHGPITGPSSNCVDHYRGGANGSTSIVVWPCNNGGTQLWTVGPKDTLEIQHGCLSVDQDATTAGSLIVISDCRGVDSQIWRQQADGTIVNPVSGRCLNAPALTANTQFTLADCGTASAQQWRLPTTPVITFTNPGDQRTPTRTAVNLPTKATFTGTAQLAYGATGLPAGLSIDPATGVISGTTTAAGSSSVRVSVSAGTASASVSFTWTTYETQPVGGITNPGSTWCADINGAYTVQLWSCNHSGPQTWTVRADGRLSILSTKCMTPLADGSTAGTRIVAADCNNDDAAQIWHQQSDGTILNTASGLCLNVTTFGATAPFSLAACTGVTGEQWTLPTAT